MTLGYLDEPEETAAILHDGWLWTGDLASRDADGFLFHQGRSKEILKIGGHRVSPVEIEHVVARHPDVAEAAVIGIPDALMGEVPAAFVVLRPGRRPGDADLRAVLPGGAAAVQGAGELHGRRVAAHGTRPESSCERSWPRGRRGVDARDPSPARGTRFALE